MRTRQCELVVPALLLVLLLVGCDKKEGDSTKAASPVAAATTPATMAATTPATTQGVDSEDAVEPLHPIAPLEDEHESPGVWLSVNGRADAAIPQGWPIIIRATALGGRGKPITFVAEDVSLSITTAAGAKAGWPVSRAAPATKPATAPLAVTLMANETTGATVTWVVGANAAVAHGRYHLEAALKGAVAHGVDVSIVAPINQPTAAQQTERFLLDGHAALWLGHAASALKQAEARLAAKPNDVPALHLKADALADMGKRPEAAAAYMEALTQFSLQNPKALEPPEILLEGLDRVTDRRPPAK